jgi:hypothetical protein
LVLVCELSALGGQASAVCPLPVIGAFIVVASITQTGTAITASWFFHLSGCHSLAFCVFGRNFRIIFFPAIARFAVLSLLLFDKSRVNAYLQEGAFQQACAG